MKYVLTQKEIMRAIGQYVTRENPGSFENDEVLSITLTVDQGGEGEESVITASVSKKISEEE